MIGGSKSEGTMNQLVKHKSSTSPYQGEADNTVIIAMPGYFHYALVGCHPVRLISFIYWGIPQFCVSKSCAVLQGSTYLHRIRNIIAESSTD